jgi:dihydrofolate reductase
MKVFVASRTLRAKDHPDVTIIDDNLKETVTRLCEQPGKDIWLFGGGGLFRSLLDAKLVDTVEVGVIPVMLGSGIPLLPPGSRAKLKLTNHKVYPKTGTVGLEYAVQYGG